MSLGDSGVGHGISFLLYFSVTGRCLVLGCIIERIHPSEGNIGLRMRYDVDWTSFLQRNIIGEAQTKYRMNLLYWDPFPGPPMHS